MATLSSTLATAPAEDQEDLTKPKAAAPAVPTDLKSTLQAGQQAISQSATEGPVEDPLDDKRSGFYINKIKEVQSNPKFMADTPPDVQATLQKAIDRAEGIYKEKSERNEWLEVAQTLGRAVAQIGASAAGMKSGRDMSRLEMGNPIDYNSRSDRALREYDRSVQNAGQQASLTHQSFVDTNKSKKDNLSREVRPYEEGLKAAMAADRDDSAEDRADKRLNQQLGHEDKRERDRIIADNNHQMSKELKNLNDDEKDLSKQAQAAKTLATALQQEPDLTTKEATKLKEKYSALAGAAGIDLTSTIDTYNKTAPKRPRQILGMNIPGTEVIDAPNATKSLYDAMGLTGIQAKLDAVRERRRQLQSQSALPEKFPSGQTTAPSVQSSVTPPAAVAPQAAPAQASGSVKMKAPNGQVGDIPADKVKDAEAKGFTRV